MWSPYMILSDLFLCKEKWEKVIRRIRLQGIFYLTLGTYEVFSIWSKSAISLFGNYFHRIHNRFMNAFPCFITRWFLWIWYLVSVKRSKSILMRFLIHYEMISQKWYHYKSGNCHKLIRILKILKIQFFLHFSLQWWISTLWVQSVDKTLLLQGLYCLRDLLAVYLPLASANLIGASKGLSNPPLLVLTSFIAGLSNISSLFMRWW